MTSGGVMTYGVTGYGGVQMNSGSSRLLENVCGGDVDADIVTLWIPDFHAALLFPNYLLAQRTM